jgi:hypothetical protein
MGKFHKSLCCKHDRLFRLDRFHREGCLVPLQNSVSTRKSPSRHQ